MSAPAYTFAQMRVWSDAELAHRDMAQGVIVKAVSDALLDLNRSWRFSRVEAPMLVPRPLLSAEYGDDDLWTTQVDMGGEQIVLRPETTPTTYAAIRALHPQGFKPPWCFWQVGKSFRREKQSTAARLRFFEFTQLEMQCLYALDTKADYRAAVLPALSRVVGWLTVEDVRVVPSERVPGYATETMDVEVRVGRDSWREIASVSQRTDWPGLANLEVAVGLDRIVDVFCGHAVMP